MKKANQYTVDKVFSELQGYSPELGEAQLDDFAVRLDKMRFLHFGWRHFNIYYTVLAGFCLVCSIYSIGYYLMTPPAETKVVYKISVEPSLQDTNLNEKEATIITKEQTKRNETPRSVVTDTTKSVLTSESSQSDNDNMYQQSSYGNTSAADTLRSQLKVDSAMLKPVVYIRKRDTIFTYDTIKVKKRKR